MVKNKKGFTLIELLAVIIILTIILSITMVFVVRIINDAKKEAFRNSAYGLIKSAENKHLSNLLKGKEKEFISEYKNFSFFNGEKLDFKGTIPKEGTIAILNGKVGLAITNGNWCAKKEYDDSKITIIKYTKSKCVFKMNDELIVFVANPISMSANEVEEIFITNEDDEIIGLTDEGKSFPRVIIPDIIDGESATVDEEQILEEAQSIEISLIRGSESEVEEIIDAYNKTPLINISLVLDVSGSMAKTLHNGTANDSSTNPEKHSRLKILKETAINLIDSFKDNPNIFVSIIPYSNTANNPSPIYNTTMEYTKIKNRIGNLGAQGGTNTGDGLRRSYYSFKDFREKLDIDENRPINNIMFLMTDGVVTYASVTKVVNETITIPTDVGEVYTYEGYDYIRPTRNAVNTITVYKDEGDSYTVGTREYSKAGSTEYKEVYHDTDKGNSYIVTETIGGIGGTEYQVEYIYDRTENYWGRNRYYYKAFKYEYKSYNYTFNGVKKGDYFTENNNNIANLKASDNTDYPEGAYAGNGSNLDPWGTEYVKIIGDLIKDYKVGTIETIDSYVVGFSAVPDDLLYIEDTVEAINAKEIFIAQTSEELEDSFNELLTDAMNKSIQIIR